MSTLVTVSVLAAARHQQKFYFSALLLQKWPAKYFGTCMLHASLYSFELPTQSKKGK